MSLNKEELKAKLLAKAEAAIEQLMRDERLHDQMTLSEPSVPEWVQQLCSKV